MPGFLRSVRRPGPLVAISLIYFIGASALMIWRGISVSPDYIFLLLVPVGLLSGRFLGFLRDWVPFVAIFLGWEAMRGIAPKLGFAPHVADLAAIERTLFFGNYPNHVLQAAITGTPRTVLTLICTVIYFLHFVLPLAIGMVLWLVDRTQFLRFTMTLMAMAFVAFFIYLLAPTAPPWYAQLHGIDVGAHKLSADLPSALSPAYQQIWNLNPNEVAALPSLHSAFPFLGFLALRKHYPRASWLAFGWACCVWFSVVFLGEHWVIDVIAGVAMAAAAWWLMMHVVVPRSEVLQDAVDSGHDAAAISDDPGEQRAIA